MDVQAETDPQPGRHRPASNQARANRKSSGKVTLKAARSPGTATTRPPKALHHCRIVGGLARIAGVGLPQRPRLEQLRCLGGGQAGPVGGGRHQIAPHLFDGVDYRQDGHRPIRLLRPQGLRQGGQQAGGGQRAGGVMHRNQIRFGGNLRQPGRNRIPPPFASRRAVLRPHHDDLRRPSGQQGVAGPHPQGTAV